MSKIWFISDVHFGHKAILKYQPKRLEKMSINPTDSDSDKHHTKYLIEQWNNTIAKNDVVYICGDLSFYNREATRRILEKLHGKKHLILGNHDSSSKGLENYFESVSQIKSVVFKKHEYEFLDEDLYLELCHFPILTWNQRQKGVVMVHGHTHGRIDDINELSKELRVDVGYDGSLANMEFISLEDLYIHCKKISGGLLFKKYIEKKMLDDGRRY